MKTRVAHLTVLAGFALAQPLYDILRRNGEFFVAHRTTPGDILLLVLWLSAAVPCVLGLLLWLVSRASVRAATALMTILVGAFVTMIALPVIAHRSSIGVVSAFLAGAVPGVVAAVLYWRFRLARQFLTLLSPAGVIFPLVFLLHPAMRPFVHLTDPTLRSGAEISGDTPVVFLIFDQLPLSSLLDPTGSIDARRFPGFAALAGDSIWFRNATTNADFTAWAVPALLSGKFPHSTRLPIAADYPHNLFTALGM